MAHNRGTNFYCRVLANIHSYGIHFKAKEMSNVRGPSKNVHEKKISTWKCECPWKKNPKLSISKYHAKFSEPL